MNRKLTQEAMGVKGKLMGAGMGAEALADTKIMKISVPSKLRI